MLLPTAFEREAMVRERAGTPVAGSGAPGPGPPRRLAVAGLAVFVVLLLVIAVLVTRLVSAPAAGSAKAAVASPSPSASATLTVPAIYQRLAPSVVLIRAGRDLGTGVIVADDGTILTAAHVVAGAKSITVTFADGTTAQARVSGADTKLDIATLIPEYSIFTTGYLMREPIDGWEENSTSDHFGPWSSAKF